MKLTRRDFLKSTCLAIACPAKTLELEFVNRREVRLTQKDIDLLAMLLLTLQPASQPQPPGNVLGQGIVERRPRERAFDQAPQPGLR